MDIPKLKEFLTRFVPYNKEARELLEQLDTDLNGLRAEKKAEPWNGKVVCVKADTGGTIIGETVYWFTPGKIYEVKKGEIIDDQGYVWSPSTYFFSRYEEKGFGYPVFTSFEEMNEFFENKVHTRKHSFLKIVE